MKTRMVQIALILLLVMVFLTVASAPGAWAKEIKIGVLMPLTGYIAFFGKMQETVLKMVQKELGKMGPAAGFELKFIVYDTGSKPQDAILMAQKLMHTDNVLQIIGPFLSTECEQVFPIVNRDKVPIVTASSAKPGLTEASRPWTFRNVLTSDKVNEPTVRMWVNQNNIKTAAILTDIKSKVSETYGKGVAPALLKKYGVEVKESIDFVTEDVDFSAQITKVKGANPDGIVLAGEYHLAANIAREARKQGLKQPFIGDVPITTVEYIKLGGPAVEGTYASSDFWAGNPDSKVQTFVKKFKEEYGQDKDPHLTTESMYDTLHITRHLVGKLGISGKPEDLQKDREKIRNGWATLKDFPGVSGKISIDKNGEAIKGYYTLVVKGGNWVNIKK
jgi:branched-chain amino acid transport system substrate-binding protein